MTILCVDAQKHILSIQSKVLGHNSQTIVLSFSCVYIKVLIVCPSQTP